MTVADFRNIRDNVQIEKVAEWLGMKLNKKILSEQLRCECPLHGGGSRALVITPSKNRYYCFHPQCLEGGDALQLTAKVRQIPLRDAAISLQSHFLNHVYRSDFSPDEKLAKVEAHHTDYAQPLNVVWLCTSCHADADKAMHA